MLKISVKLMLCKNYTTKVVRKFYTTKYFACKSNTFNFN